MNSKSKSKTGIFLSIMVLSMYLNIENMVSLLLSGISEAFPNASLVQIQNIYSYIMLVELFTNFIVGYIASKLSKRKIIIYFQGLTVLGGLIAFFFGKSLAMLYFSSVMIGFSAAIVSTISKSIITENYPDSHEAAKVFGAQQMAQSIGTMMLQVLVGYLAIKGWKWGYLSFLFGLVSLFSGLFLLPEGPKETISKEKNTSKAKLWTPQLIHDVAVTTLYIMLFVVYNYNISYLVGEKNFGNVAIAGYLSALWTGVLFIAAMMLPKVYKKMGKYTIAFCIASLAMGFGVIAYSENIWLTVIAIIVSAFAQGIFSPTMYLNVSEFASKEVVTSSMAMINAGASLGVYLVPYLVTAPSVIIGTTAQARFITAAIELCILFIAETIYVKKKYTA